MNRAMKIILTVSLLLNVTLVGLGIGYSYKAWRYRMPDGAADARMSESAREAMTARFDEMRDRMKDTFMDMRAARKALTDVMEAESFDPAAYDSAWETLALLQSRMGAARADAVRDLAAGMEAGDRRALAHYLAGPFGGKRHGGRCGGKWGDKYGGKYGAAEPVPGAERRPGPRPPEAPPTEE